MKEKKLFVLIGIVATVIVFAGIFFKKQALVFFDFSDQAEKLKATVLLDTNLPSSEQSIAVAICPTFYHLIEKLEEKEGLRAIKTQSTSESLKLLQEKEVDLIISGRPLKHNEPELLFKEIGPGYDFIFKEEVFILENEMSFISFYTDLFLDEIIKDFEYISENNLRQVNDIYQYLDKGIVITSLQRITKGDIVHILKEDDSRVHLSRKPRIYYFPELKEEKLSLIKGIIKEN